MGDILVRKEINLMLKLHHRHRGNLRITVCNLRKLYKVHWDAFSVEERKLPIVFSKPALALNSIKEILPRCIRIIHKDKRKQESKKHSKPLDRQEADHRGHSQLIWVDRTSQSRLRICSLCFITAGKKRKKKESKSNLKVSYPELFLYCSLKLLWKHTHHCPGL